MIFSSNTAIQLKDIRKVYKLYQKPSDWLREIFFSRPFHQAIESPDNVSLEVVEGNDSLIEKY